MKKNITVSLSGLNINGSKLFFPVSCSPKKVLGVNGSN